MTPVASKTSLEQKVTLAGYGLAAIAVMFVILTLCVIFSRVLTVSPVTSIQPQNMTHFITKNPVTHANNKVVATFDRCLVNTLEQAWIFIPNYLIWIFVG